MNRNCAFFCINLSRELLLWIFSVNLEEKKKEKNVSENPIKDRIKEGEAR